MIIDKKLISTEFSDKFEQNLQKLSKFNKKFHQINTKIHQDVQKSEKGGEMREN
jgi:hypothetical protein